MATTPPNSIGGLRVRVVSYVIQPGTTTDIVCDCWRMRILFNGRLSGYTWNGNPLDPSASGKVSLEVNLGGLSIGPNMLPVNLNEMVRIVASEAADALGVWIERQIYDPRVPNLQAQ